MCALGARSRAVESPPGGSAGSNPGFGLGFPSRRVGLGPPTVRLGRSSPIWRIRGCAVSWAGVTTLGSGLGALVTPNGVG